MHDKTGKSKVFHYTFKFPNGDKINKNLCQCLSKEINPPNNIIPDVKTLSVSVEWAGGKILSYGLVISEDETLKSLRNKIHELLPKNIWYDPEKHKIFLGHGGHELASLDQINNGDTLVVLPDLKNMIEFGCGSAVLSVAFSPDNKIIAAGYNDGTVKLLSVEDGSLIRTLEGHTDYVKSVTFSPDGKLLGSGSHEGTVKLWKINSLIKNYKSKVKILNADKFSIKYSQIRTQGIVVSFEGQIKKELPQFNNNDDDDIALLLGDQIKDPQNLGQIIRTAECSGIDGLIIPDRDSAQITNSVLQVSQGAFASLPIYSCGNVQQTLQQLKKEGFWIIGVENDTNGKLWYEIDYTGKVIIVIGSEGKGIRQLVKHNCDFIATIPMQGKINSLNVSASVSAILFERQRQILTQVKE